MADTPRLGGSGPERPTTRLVGFSETLDEHTEKALTRRFGLAVPLYLAGALSGVVLPVFGFAIFAAPAIFFWLPLGQRDPEGDDTAETSATST
jgi:hypothetical protein